jgi:serine/threonine-protein phosphatase 2A regulatory subunit B''
VSDRDTSGVITLPQFLAWWLAEVEPFDPTTRFFRLVKQPTAPAIEPSDFQPIMEELLAFHPGLEFLQQTAEFQEKYVRTVIARIFFEWDPPHRRALSLRTLRRSNLVEAFHEVDIQNDINQVNEYFSYEHFYVLYCKFWELDTDHDYFLSRADLARMTHITPLALDRVYAQAGKPCLGGGGAAKAMGYEDFICFFLASEDKTMPASLK